LYFTYFSALDEIQHVFWPYCDPSHPRYPGPNEFESVILDFYREVDRSVGRLVAECRSDDKIIVISDHGQGARPSLVFNINEWLRRKEYLHPTGKQGIQPKNRMKSLIKKGLLSFVDVFGAGSIILSISKRFPVWKRMLAPSSGIDWTKTKAYVSDLSAIKNYSYGGIRINSTDTREAEIMINDIIKSIKEVRIPGGNGTLVKLVCRREELYQGKHIDKYPEIVLELDDRYGIGWSFSGDLFSDEAHLFQLKPGTHRRSTAVFLSKNVNKSILKKEMELMDIAPLVKSLFNIGSEQGQ
jgi:predicted AlkP superfamily phosphohydrolase/phosphomutase